MPSEEKHNETQPQVLKKSLDKDWKDSEITKRIIKDRSLGINLMYRVNLKYKIQNP